MTANLRDVFESQLHAAWQVRDFPAWLEARAIYADWLEENDDPLGPMARCAVRMHAVTSNLKGGEKRPWLWRLYFVLPPDLGKQRPRWWANLRTNGKQLLGFPPFTLRCEGWEEETRELRFAVNFYPYRELRLISRLQHIEYGWQKPSATDTDLHPDGFAACFWPDERTPSDWHGRRDRPIQPSLFDGRGEEDA